MRKVESSAKAETLAVWLPWSVRGLTASSVSTILNEKWFKEKDRQWRAP